MYNKLAGQRIVSIDAFRGITILVMIFVNELAGVSGIPLWMKHVHAGDDGMTFVDVVFPAFLFIVGMSIPFAIKNRIAKGDNFWQLQAHILFRTAGLLVLGLFMVNAEGGYNEVAMGMSIYVWSLLFYSGVILIWNVYPEKQKAVAWTLRTAGVLLLLFLAYRYRGGETGTETMTPQWWGILGLIGWAYLIAVTIYQLTKGNLYIIIALIAVSVPLYSASQSGAVSDVFFVGWLANQSGHAIHVSIVLCGMVVTLLFFGQYASDKASTRFAWVFVFAGFLTLVAFMLRPYYTISKIGATPSWAFYSAAICSCLFAFFYWLIDLQKVSRWTSFFKPAAANPLLTYIIPFIVGAAMHVLHLTWPAIFYDGFIGALWALTYAVAVMAIVIGLNRLRIRLQL